MVNKLQFLSILTAMKTPKNKIPALFNFLYETSMLNGRAVDVQYEDRTSLGILMQGSGSLPRKRKKHLRNLIQKVNKDNNN